MRKLAAKRGNRKKNDDNNAIAKARAEIKRNPHSNLFAKEKVFRMKWWLQFERKQIQQQYFQ